MITSCDFDLNELDQLAQLPAAFASSGFVLLLAYTMSMPQQHREQQGPLDHVVTWSHSGRRSTPLTRNKTANETASRITDNVSATFSSCSKP